MGGFVHDVSRLELISRKKAVYCRLKYGFIRRVERALIGAGNFFNGFPPMQTRRLAFYDLSHKLFGYCGVPSVRQFNGKNYLQCPLEEDDARRALISIGVASTFDVKPVYDVGGGNYVLSYWYYDGGSDGHEEYEEFQKKVDRYFASLAV